MKHKKLLLVYLVLVLTFTLMAATKAYIGVVLSELDRSDYSEYKLSEPHGIKITAISKDSPAEKEKLKKGDLILSIEGNKIFTIDQLHKIIAFKKPGDKIEMTIFRNGKILKKNLKLGSIDDPTKKAYLGVFLEEVEDDKSEYPVMISDIVDESPAEKAGIQAKDLVVEFNNERIFTVDQFTKMIELKNPDDEVPISLKRINDILKLKVKLGSKKASFNNFFEGKYSANFNFPENVFMYKYNDEKWIGISLNKNITKTNSDGKEEVKISAIIEAIIPNSPAEKAGLKKDDQIIKIDGKKISKKITLENIIETKNIDDEIELELKRNGKLITKKVIIGKRDNPDKNIKVLYDNGILKIDIDGKENEILEIEELLKNVKEKVHLQKDNIDNIRYYIDKKSDELDFDIEINDEQVH